MLRGQFVTRRALRGHLLIALISRLGSDGKRDQGRPLIGLHFGAKLHEFSKLLGAELHTNFLLRHSQTHYRFLTHFIPVA